MIKFDNCNISGNGVGISAPKGTEMTISRTTIADNGIGVVERNPEEESGGAEIAKAFIEAARADGADADQLLKDYGPGLKAKGFDLDIWLARGANAATIVKAAVAVGSAFGLSG